MTILANTVNARNILSVFFQKHGKFLLLLLAYFLLFFVIPHAFAGTTQGDLTAVDKHVKSEVTGDIMDILGWTSLGLGCIFAVAKMNLTIVITMFGIFLLLILGPDVISAHFSALI